jgi:hypothetical protein
MKYLLVLLTVFLIGCADTRDPHLAISLDSNSPIGDVEVVIELGCDHKYFEIPAGEQYIYPDGSYICFKRICKYCGKTQESGWVDSN